jgi:hypothetical protein
VTALFGPKNLRRLLPLLHLHLLLLFRIGEGRVSQHSTDVPLSAIPLPPPPPPPLLLLLLLLLLQLY